MLHCPKASGLKNVTALWLPYLQFLVTVARNANLILLSSVPCLNVSGVRHIGGRSYHFAFSIMFHLVAIILKRMLQEWVKPADNALRLRGLRNRLSGVSALEHLDLSTDFAVFLQFERDRQRCQVLRIEAFIKVQVAVVKIAVHSHGKKISAIVKAVSSLVHWVTCSFSRTLTVQ